MLFMLIKPPLLLFDLSLFPLLPDLPNVLLYLFLYLYRLAQRLVIQIMLFSECYCFLLPLRLNYLLKLIENTQ